MDHCADAKKRAYLELCRMLETRNSEPMPLDQLCAEHGLSVFALNRLFKKWMGISPKSWQRKLRLNEAAILLVRTSLDILSIACTVGYESQQSFTRAFNRAYAVTPARFRQNFWLQHGKPSPATPTRLPVVPKALPELHILRRRYLGNYADIPQHWQDFSSQLDKLELEHTHGLFLGLTWDDPAITLPGQIRYDCAVLHAGDLPSAPSLDWVICDVPAGAYAAMRHQGHYEGVVAGAYTAIVCDWLPISSWQLDMRPAIELYNTPPWRQQEESWSFEVLVPIV